MADPLDVVLCPGCASELSVVRHDDGDGSAPWFSCICPACGYSLADGADSPPATLRELLSGLGDCTGFDDVNLGALLAEVVRRVLEVPRG